MPAPAGREGRGRGDDPGDPDRRHHGRVLLPDPRQRRARPRGVRPQRLVRPAGHPRCSRSPCMDLNLQPGRTTVAQFHPRAGSSSARQGSSPRSRLQQKTPFTDELRFQPQRGLPARGQHHRRRPAAATTRLPAGTHFDVHAQGDLFLGPIDINGGFDFPSARAPCSSTSRRMAVLGPLGGDTRRRPEDRRARIRASTASSRRRRRPRLLPGASTPTSSSRSTRRPSTRPSR